MLGKVEQRVRQEVPEGSALAEIAFVLAKSLDDEPSASAARELRLILAQIKTEQAPDEHDPVASIRAGV